MDLYSLLMESALREGFPIAGAVDIDLAFSSEAHSFQKHIDRFDQWLNNGFQGSMDYLKRGRDRRADPRLLFPEAQSVFCVALPYPRKAAGAPHPAQGPRYARYLQGKDYHLELAEKLERVMQSVQAEWKLHPNSSELKWKICVDTSAVLERSWAALAGLGWIGKNTLLIHPKHGSYLFLAEVLLNQTTGKDPSPLPDYCGHCTRCLRACPTQALESPRTLNSNRCLSYWTLEKRGNLQIHSEDQMKIGPWIAGCDICQEVCPFNLKPTRIEENLGDFNSIPENATQLQTWKSLLEESPDKYKARVQSSAMKRIKPAQFSRNLAVTLSNTFSQLPELERNELFKTLQPLILKRQVEESDEVSKQEWSKLLNQFDSNSSPNRNP